MLFIPGFNVRQPSRKRTIFDVWCSDPYMAFPKTSFSEIQLVNWTKCCVFAHTVKDACVVHVVHA